MSGELENFIEHVDEELREDRVHAFWQKNKETIVAAVVVFFLVLFGYAGWRHYWESRTMQAANLYLDAMSQDNKDKSIPLLDQLLQNYGSHSGYKALARLVKSGELLRAGKKEEALTELEQMQNDFGVDPLLKEMALMNAAYTSLPDGKKTEEYLNRLPAETAFKASALELRGILKQQNSDIAAALTLYREALANHPGQDQIQRLNRRIERLAEP